jgi:hypothetical protein
MKIIIRYIASFKKLIIILTVAMLFSLYASDASYVLYYDKLIPDSFTLYEYEKQGSPVTSVAMKNPTIGSYIGVADVYITSSKKLSFDITSANGFNFRKSATTAPIEYELYSEVNYQTEYIALNGNNRLTVKSDYDNWANKYGFSLLVKLISPSPLEGSYSDTLTISMVVNE